MSTEAMISVPTGTDRRFPPVTQMATVALACVVVGGILMASYAPRRPPLVLPLVLLALAVVLFGTALIVLAGVKGFAWDTFALVGRWALLAYVVVAGMIEFAFVKNHTRGTPLVVVTSMLVVFATDVPFIIATTVARYATPQPQLQTAAVG
jgi:hypothetical protein